MHECSEACISCPMQHAALFRWQDLVGKIHTGFPKSQACTVSHSLAGSSLEAELNLSTLTGGGGHG